MIGDLELFTNQLGIPGWMIFILLAWILVWKALACWKSARLNQPIWFIVLFLINTIGLLEILYIFVFSEYKIRAGGPAIKKKRKR